MREFDDGPPDPRDRNPFADEPAAGPNPSPGSSNSGSAAGTSDETPSSPPSATSARGGGRFPPPTGIATDEFDGEDSFAGRWLRRRGRGGPNRARYAMAAIAVLAIGGFGWWWFRIRTPEIAFSGNPMTVIRADSTPVTPPLELPELEESDSFIRDMVGFLSAHPKWAEWLATDALIERFVVSVVNVANGASPAEHVQFLAPTGDFEVQEATGPPDPDAVGERLVIDPANYRRFDVLTQVVSSLDTQGSTRLFHGLHPLFEEAYAELGFPDGSFDQVLAQAIRNVVSVQIPDGPIEIVGDAGGYEFADPRLEGLSAAQKHVLRLGPDNARRVQMKLRELAQAFGLRLPAGETE